MKTKFTLICVLTLLAYACGSDDDSSPYKCSSCATTPEANADYDDSGKGIYKGLVVGSSGTMKFNIGNDGTYTAALTIDGEAYELTTSDTFDEVYGFEGTFFGTMNTADDIEIGFYASADGLAYYVYSVEIPGHENVTVELYKETSDELVQVFEGRYSGDEAGAFNLVVQGTVWDVVARDDDDTTGADESYFEGTLDGNTLVCDCGDIVITGSISGDGISGQWSAGDDNGSWEGVRTL